MRKLIGTFVFVVLLSLTCVVAEAQQEAIVGHWEGAYGRLGRCRL